MENATRKVVWCGIDTSKKTFESAIERSAGKHACQNNKNKPSEFASFVAWARKTAGEDVELKFCMESSGDYGDDLALFLVEEGFHVSVVNPALPKKFGEYKGRLNKTDRADAKLIADFARDSSPQAWAMTDPTKRALFRLNRRRAQLVKLETMESNRRECPSAIGPACVESIRQILKAIRAELRSIERQLLELVQADEALARDSALIQTIPVLSDGSAHAVFAEMPPIDRSVSAKNWAAASGANPVNRQSGTSLHSGQMARGGRKGIRRQLWMCTLNAIGVMPEIRDLYNRLRARGKLHRQAMVACLRKLLMIIYGVLKHQRPYEAPVAA